MPTLPLVVPCRGAFRGVRGRCTAPELAELAAASFRALRLPAVRLRAVVSAEA